MQYCDQYTVSRQNLFDISYWRLPTLNWQDSSNPLNSVRSLKGMGRSRGGVGDAAASPRGRAAGEPHRRRRRGGETPRRRTLATKHRTYQPHIATNRNDREEWFTAAIESRY